ncbi:MAG TPA: FxLYD domain-containing protein [Bryobacteraceae bacterium]|jgi:hypothetical protein
MLTRLCQFFESIVYAGLKPGTPAGPRPMRWLGPLRGPLERLLTTQAPSDPLYLSNRTLGQKLKLAAIIVVPVALIGVGLWMALSNRLGLAGAATTPEPTAAEISRRVLPHLDKNIQLPANREIEVMEVHVEPGAEPKLACTVRNNTTRPIQNGEVIFDLTDVSGSQLGAVPVPVSLQPMSSTKFQIAIRQRTAAFALVREVRTK